MAVIKELGDFADKLELEVCGESEKIPNFTDWLEDRANKMEEDLLKREKAIKK